MAADGLSPAPTRQRDRGLLDGRGVDRHRVTRRALRHVEIGGDRGRRVGDRAGAGADARRERHFLAADDRHHVAGVRGGDRGRRLTAVGLTRVLGQAEAGGRVAVAGAGQGDEAAALGAVEDEAVANQRRRARHRDREALVVVVRPVDVGDQVHVAEIDQAEDAGVEPEQRWRPRFRNEVVDGERQRRGDHREGRDVARPDLAAGAVGRVFFKRGFRALGHRLRVDVEALGQVDADLAQRPFRTAEQRVVDFEVGVAVDRVPGRLGEEVGVGAFEGAVDRRRVGHPAGACFPALDPEVGVGRRRRARQRRRGDRQRDRDRPQPPCTSAHSNTPCFPVAWFPYPLP